MVIILSLLTMDRIIITIVLFILLSIPFIVFQKRISTWLSSVTEEADSKKEEKENAISQNIFVLLTILLSPIFLMQVYSESQFYFYVVLYAIFAMGLLLVDPLGIITNNPLSDLVFYVTTFLSYVIIYNRPFFPITLICVMILCISMTNIARSYMESQGAPRPKKKEEKKEDEVVENFEPVAAFEMIGGGDDDTFTNLENYENKEDKKDKKEEPKAKKKPMNWVGLAFFLAYVIPFCIAFIFAVRPSLMKSLFEASQAPPTKMDIQMNYTLLTCVFFFVLVFYMTTLFKNYYGGEQWVREPISLLIPVEYKIVPSHDYTLSYWVFFDAVPPEYSTRASLFNNVVSMGDIETTYQPSTTTLRILVKDVPIPHDIPILTQTWNHVVLVGNHGQLDVYLNGNLQYTTHSISQTNESLFIGEEAGNKGKICNVVYSAKSVSPLMVQQMYAQLRLQNPPVL